MPERIYQTPKENIPGNLYRKRKRDQVDEPQSVTHFSKSDHVTIEKGGKSVRYAGISSNDQRPEHSSTGNAPFIAWCISPKKDQKTQLSSLRARVDALNASRKALPIWGKEVEIRQNLREKDVLLLIGETGSGKSTQIPQLLLSEDWCQSRRLKQSVNPIGGCIAVTEPRRVAAITLARRVAEEMGTPLGSSSPASRVGYSVRFDNSTSPSTRIKFLTEGMLLQEMLRDPWLTAYSAVVVDEVHERGANVDLVLGFLREMVGGNLAGRGGMPLKVVVMSATAEMERLKEFFEEATTTASSAGSLQSVWERAPKSNDEEPDWSGLSSSEEEKEPPDITNETQEGSSLTPFRVATCSIQGRQYPVTVKYTPEPVQDIVETSLRTVFQIHRKEPMPGDILVFLPGQDTVESLESLIQEYAEGLGPDVPKLLALPLFAALPQAAQQRVFQPAPSKTRKIIISTNIAETSVTVSGVRFVIDCGKAKIKHFRSRIGLDSLLCKPISMSAAIQRKGRAGREAPGQCYRLYTESDYQKMQHSNTPEILRCDLSRVILTIKAHGVNDVVNFPFLDDPPHEAFEKALLQIYQLGALADTGTITPIGQRMAKLPLNVSLGRVLIAASEPQFSCVAEAIDIISALSVENVFLNPTSEGKKEEAETARRDLYCREGDHLILLKTVQAYAAEHADRKAWASRHFVSHRAMQSVMNVRKQLRQQFKSLLPTTSSPDPPTTTLTPTLITTLLKCFLTGFALKTARLFPDGSYKTIVSSQTVAIHPSSAMFGRKVEAIMYNEFVFTTRSYARGVSAVEMGWIGEAMGL